jgi:hypothetical protein
MKKIAPLSTLVFIFMLAIGCADGMHEDFNDTFNMNSQVRVGNAQDKLVDATSNHSKAQEKNRNISFSSKFTVWSVPPPPGNQIQVSIAGSGTATRMGKAKLAMQETITIPDSDQWTADASIVITAANGDELHLSYTGVVDTSGTPVMAFTGTCEVNGGTGAYRQAKGTLIYKGSRSWDTGSGTATFTGEISY